MRRNALAGCSAMFIGAAMALLNGCAASNQGEQSDPGRHADVPGMMCPKCETVWLGPHVTGQGSKVQAYHWGREMACPDCDAMAASYFKDGEKVLHDCPTCKVKPMPVRSAPTRTHPKGTHS